MPNWDLLQSTPGFVFSTRQKASQEENPTLNPTTQQTPSQLTTNCSPKMTIQSDRLQSARLVESVQVRETEMVTRSEQEIRERQARQEAAQAFDVTVRTHESGHPGYSDEDTIDSMSEYTSENHIEPVLIDRSHYRQATDIDSRHYRQETNIAQMNMAQMSSTNIQLAQETNIAQMNM